MSYLVAIE